MNQPVMTPSEALEFLDAACASVSMGRPAHVKGIQAVQVLKQFIPIEAPGNGNGSEPKEEENKDASTQ